MARQKPRAEVQLLLFGAPLQPGAYSLPALPPPGDDAAYLAQRRAYFRKLKQAQLQLDLGDPA